MTSNKKKQALNKSTVVLILHLGKFRSDLVHTVLDKLRGEFCDIALLSRRSGSVLQNLRAVMPSILLLASDGCVLLLVGVELESTIS